MAEVYSEDKNKSGSMNSTETETTIGLDGHSGFSTCRMILFNMGNFTAYLGAYFIGGISTLYVSIYRAEGSAIIGGQVFLKLFGGILGVVMGMIQDSPKTAGCLNKIGCTNQKCGRRAPHAIWATAVIMIACLIVHLPPNIMNMSTTVDDTRLRKGDTFFNYRESTEINRETGKPTWGAWKPYPSDGLMNSVKGYPCDKMMEFNTTSGKIHSFTKVGSVNKAIPEFGSEICAAMVSTSSSCFPGPKGAPKEGDGNPRVCAVTDSATLGGWFLFMGILGRIGWETVWQVSHVAKWEIFPFLQDRVRVQAWSAFTFFFAFFIFIIFNLFISQSSEWGTRPEGANGYRFNLSIIATVLCGLGYLAIDPFTEAKQTTDSEQKNSSPIDDYKDIMFGKGKAQNAMRWASATYGFYTLHTTFYVSTVQYYFIYTLNIEPAVAATGVAALAITTILCDLIGVPVWGCLFGNRDKDDRLKSRDPRQAMLGACALSLVAGAIAVAIFVRPVARDVENSNIVNLVVTLFIIRAPTTLITYWLIGADGWCIDEDIQEYYKLTGKRRRRESVYKGFQLAIRALADTFVICINLIIFSTSCDSKVASENQTMACANTFYFIWQIGIPLTMCACLFCAWKFPIKGERRDDIIKGQGETHRAVGSSRKTVTESELAKTVKEVDISIPKTAADA